MLAKWKFTDNKNRKRPLLGRFLMVAEAGFEPATLRV